MKTNKLTIVLIVAALMTSACDPKPKEISESTDTTEQPALCPIQIGDKYGYADTTGQCVIAPCYSLALVRDGAKWYYINKQGDIVYDGPTAL